MPIETEIKLALDPAGLERLGGSAAVEEAALGPWRSERLRSVYYDTREGDLRAAGLALRVRYTAGGCVQAVKAKRDAIRRAEWECALPGETPDLAAVPDASVRAVLEGVRGRLGPVFETVFTRRTRVLRLPGGGSAELALDVGEIRAAALTGPPAGAARRLVGVTAAALRAMVDRLRAAVPCDVEPRTKAERGYALRDA